MAPIFTGTLPPKKKSELQEIAIALKLSDVGTKDELQNRIKKHLDANQAALEEDPTFAGLFGRRRRSVQPQQLPLNSRSAPLDSEPLKPSLGKSSLARHITSLDPIRESTPATDMHDVSMFLKHPISPTNSSPNRSFHQLDVTTPSSLPPLPPSPSMSLVERVSIISSAEVVTRSQPQHNDMLQDSRESFIRIRRFLSNSQTLWSISAVFEVLFILNNIIPWRHVQIPLSPNGYFITVFYPPWHIFQTFAFWMVIVHWAIPTLLIPTVAGTLISFNSPSQSRLPPSDLSHAPFDPLTASIVRLAAQVMYPFAYLETRAQMQGLDVLGSKWRTTNAAVVLALSFAEAIAGAPRLFAKTLVVERQYDRQLLENEDSDPSN